MPSVDGSAGGTSLSAGNWRWQGQGAGIQEKLEKLEKLSTAPGHDGMPLGVFSLCTLRCSCLWLCPLLWREQREPLMLPRTS